MHARYFCSMNHLHSQQITIEDVSENATVVFPVAKTIDPKPTRLTGKEESIGEEARKKTMRSTLKPIQYEVRVQVYVHIGIVFSFIGILTPFRVFFRRIRNFLSIFSFYKFIVTSRYLLKHRL